jgi:hypothetical protein
MLVEGWWVLERRESGADCAGKKYRMPLALTYAILKGNVVDLQWGKDGWGSEEAAGCVRHCTCRASEGIGARYFHILPLISH